MPRIRSIHPGIFTDEAFMSASAHARLLIMGIWTEAWDDGVFEWKPLTLKAKIFPVDNVDVGALLTELAGLNFVRQFEGGGKNYGVVRNFRLYQRPKKPNSSGKLPDHLAEYAGPAPSSSEPVPNQLRTRGGNSPQMEDGGGEGRVEGDEDTASAASSASAPAIDLEDAERRCCEAAGADRLGSFSPIAELLHRRADLELDVLPVMRARPAAGGKVSSWKFYVPIIAEAMTKRDPVKPAQGPPPVFVVEGTPEWDAWQRAEPGKHRAMQTNAGLGRYFPSRLPPTHAGTGKEAA